MNPEPSLRSVQEWFLALLTHPGSDQEAVAQVALDAASPDTASLERVLRPGPRQTALERLRIYRHAYVARLVECLADDFAAVQFALGNERFGALCRRYILRHPSSSPNLNVYGQHFSAFVRGQDADWAGFAAELAELEWALVDMVHTESGDGLQPGALQRVGPEQLPSVRFIASPAVRLLSFTYPVNAYLRAFLLEQRPSLPARAASAVVVARAGTRLRRVDLTPPQALLLGRLLAGEPLLQALNGVDVGPAKIQEWFAEWTELRLFAALA